MAYLTQFSIRDPLNPRLVPSHYLCVLGVRKDWGLGWGARGLMGRYEGKIATLFFLCTFPWDLARLNLTPNYLSPQKHINSDWVRVCLNPMINKIADEESAILLLICSHENWVKVTYDWSTALCLCLCLCRPCFHWSKLRHKHKRKHKKNKLVRFSCAYAYAYVDPVFTCLHMCLSLCLCAGENQAL